MGEERLQLYCCCRYGNMSYSGNSNPSSTYFNGNYTYVWKLDFQRKQSNKSGKLQQGIIEILSYTVPL